MSRRVMADPLVPARILSFHESAVPPAASAAPAPGRSSRQGRDPARARVRRGQQIPRWAIWVLGGALVAVLPPLSLSSTDDREKIAYSDLRSKVAADKVDEITWSNNDGSITGKLTDGTEFTLNGPQRAARGRPGRCSASTTSRSSSRTRSPRSSTALLPLLLPVVLFVGIFWLMQRRAQSQMGGIMSIGRSKAKTYSTERPGTTFADVAGYDGRQAGDHRGRRLPEAPRAVRRDRRPHPQGRAAGRPPGHRQDAHRPGRGRRGRRAVPVGHRLRLHGDVRRRRRQPGPRPVPERPQAGPGHHLRRRDRLDRPQARRRPRRRPRRARADPQPDAVRDGRLRGHRGHRDDGGHQPARHPRPRPAAPGPLRPPGRGAAARARRAPGDPRGALQEQAPGRRRRPRRRGPGHPRHERRRPVQPGQRGGAVRRAGRSRRDPGHATSSRPATGCSWAHGASRWRCPTPRRRSSPTTRPATRCAPRCCPRPTPCTR